MRQARDQETIHEVRYTAAVLHRSSHRVRADAAGNHFFAPESVLIKDGRRIMWAWIMNLPTEPTGVQSLPRELPDDGVLRIRPLRELGKLRNAEKSWRDIENADGSEFELDGLTGDAVELEITFAAPVPMNVGLRVLGDAQGEDAMTILAGSGRDGNHTTFRTEPTMLNAYNCTQLYEVVGWTSVQPDNESATIELKSAAGVRGRVVREDGSPVVGAAIHTPYFYDPTEKLRVLPSQPKQGYYSHTDSEGRFEFVGLAPDLPLTVMTDQKDEARNRLLARHYLFAGLQFKPDEIRDLGNLRIDKLREWKPE